MQTDNILSPKERLMIAAQQMPALPWPFNQTNEQRAAEALSMADALIAESGCIVSGTEGTGHEMD